MRLRVLGCSGAEMPGHAPPGFLVDDDVLLDAGTVTSVMDAEAQRHIRHIFVTHAHLDHVRSIPALADNLILGDRSEPVCLHGITPVLESIRRHILNDSVWPDFTEIPAVGSPVLTYEPMPAATWVTYGDLRAAAVAVHHSVPASGYLLERGGRVLLYTGDTGPTDRIWTMSRTVHTVMVEVSFPDRMTDLALKTGHLSPALLGHELKKLPGPPERVMIIHLKPQYAEETRREIAALGLPGLVFPAGGDEFEI